MKTMHAVRKQFVSGTRAFGFAALLLALGAGGATAQTIVMKLSTATLNDAQHEWMKRFAAKIETNSGGRIKAEIYPASQLGAIPRQIEGTSSARSKPGSGRPNSWSGSTSASSS